MFVMDGLAFASEPKASMKVLDAKAVNGLSRLVIFSTGGKRLFDASELTDKPAFKSLKDSRIFGAFSIDHDIVTWDNGEIHLDPELKAANHQQINTILSAVYLIILKQKKTSLFSKRNVPAVTPNLLRPIL